MELQKLLPSDERIHEMTGFLFSKILVYMICKEIKFVNNIVSYCKRYVLIAIQYIQCHSQLKSLVMLC